MIVDHVTKTNGDPLNLDTLIVCMGYQVEHSITGRILPTCSHHEIYSLNAVKIKMEKVCKEFQSDPEFNILEYELVPIYNFEVEYGFAKITHKIY